MMDRPELLFGISVDPGIENPEDAFVRARIADEAGIDLLMIQDHPYIDRFFDTWTLLAMIAARTERVHLSTNVSPLPLRPPAMLAKAVASLDVLTGGRAELGIGTGAFTQGIQAFGGTARQGGEAVATLEEAIQIIRGLWNSERGFTFHGEHYQVQGARFGPKPAHPIRIWVGATKPRMLRLTGRLADGVSVSNSYVPEDQLADVNRFIDEGATQAGRSPSAIRRCYNLMGVIELPNRSTRPEDLRAGTVSMPASDWVDWLVHLYQDRRMDTLNFWPLGNYQRDQLEAFASDVVPAVRAALKQ